MKRMELLVYLFSALICVAAVEDVKSELQQTVHRQGIAQELENAPDGTTIRLFPGGEFQIFSVGTGTYDFNDVDDIQDAQREATMKAKANLAKFINESLSTDEQMEEMSSKSKYLSSEDGNTASNVDKKTYKEALSTIRSSSSALLKGVITISSAKLPGKGESGTYRVMVGVSSKTLAAVSKMVEGTSRQPIVADGTANSAAGKTFEATGITAGEEAGVTSDVLPGGWIECVGKGAERRTAVSAALTEGIQQVYGVSLQNNARMSERMKKLKVNSNALRVSMKESSSDTLTQTAGFVREYRIISVNTTDDGLMEAVIHALIVNPRVGGTLAVMLHKPSMSLDKLTNNYELGPNRRVSGSEICDVVGKAFSNAFANANLFLVLTMDDLSSVCEQQQLGNAMVSASLAPAQELMKAGQLLTADYILTSNIENLKYARTMGLNKATKKFGPVYAMSIRMSYKLTDVTTGQAMLMEDIMEKLENEEITALLAENADVDLLLALMAKVTLSINEKIQQN